MLNGMKKSCPLDASVVSVFSSDCLRCSSMVFANEFYFLTELMPLSLYVSLFIYDDFVSSLLYFTLIYLFSMFFLEVWYCLTCFQLNTIIIFIVREQIL